MPTPTDLLTGLADARDSLEAEGPPGLTQLAAQVALVEAALVVLVDTSPNRDALLSWLHVAGAEADHNTPTGYAMRGAARRLSGLLGG